MADETPIEPDAEFDQFTNLTRKLLAVSKEDLDKERKAEAEIFGDSKKSIGPSIRNTITNET